MNLSGLDYLAAGGAALAAGAINAVAGGGSLVSFPTLVAIGVPAVSSNVTNTVALLPGYVGGSWAQREELRPQLSGARLLAVAGAAGGLVGSVLLVTIPAEAFRLAVPYLILLACALLLFQDRLRTLIKESPDGEESNPRPALIASVFAAAIYGGFFGAGLGIMVLALLGLFSIRPLTELNAVKQVLSLVINSVAAVFFVFTGHVVWQLIPVMAAASIVGGTAGGRLVRVIDSTLLSRLVVVAGVAVAVAFWVA